MNALDELLHGAANRLDQATTTMIAPDLPDPSRTGARVAVGVVCLAAVAATGYAVSLRNDSTGPADLPPGLREGRYGTEIVMRELPDGDNDPETFSLEANPGGGYVKVTKPTGGTTKVTVSDGSQESSAADVCLDAPSGGMCGTAAQLAQTPLIVGPRGVDGQVIAFGVPATAVAVTLSAGTEKHWSMPVHGVVAFPFPETASPAVTVNALDSDGNTVWKQSTTDSSRTQAEIAALAVTHQTAAFMADGYFGDIPPGATWGPEVVRRHGRTYLTGFTGPFAAQSYLVGSPVGADNSDWVYAITVPTDRLPDIRERLATVSGGKLRRSVEPAAGVSVVIWGGHDVPDSEIDRFAGTLVQRPPTEPYPSDLDVLAAFPSNPPLFSEDGNPLNAILSDVVGTVDGHDLIAQSDDIGTVEFHVAGTNGSRADLGGPVDPNQYALSVGDSVRFDGLMPLAPDVTGYTITLDDGTVVEPEIIDGRPLVDGKLLYFADAHKGRTIADIQITTD